MSGAGASRDAVAVVGMAGRFPGAPDLDRFWLNLRQGVESVTFFSAAELAAAGVDPARLADPSYVPARPVLAGVELFDAGFFGFTPREAELTDPQHRLFLECAWEALESAGHDPERFPGAIGVYAGASMNGYLLHNLLRSEGLIDAAAGFQVLTGNDKDYLATRVSYKLNLRGPSLSVQTACSTSLVAVHLASESLLNRECDMALAGGVSVSVPQVSGYPWFEGGIFSPDGHCRSFDAGAQGTLFGSGVGVVALRRLEDALADGDPIRAVLLGSAVNNDGSRKVGFTAPGLEGQARVISEALGVAGAGVETIGYVEAHGTATPMGDPIEVEALTRVFQAATARRGFCALGSVKTNFGHLETAAGVAGLIKTVLALENEEIPPSLHFERPNPRIDFAATPFYVNAALAPWPRGGTPRRAGVSSFGIGGTNAHVVLEEAPPPVAAAPSRPEQLLLLSARTPEALEAVAIRLREHLENHPELPLADVAYTLQAGRRAFDQRLALACRGREEALAALAAPGRLRSGTRGEPRGVVMLFPGQGAQFPGMGAGLYRGEAPFREEVDRCAAILTPLLGCDLRTLIAPAPGTAEEAGRLLARTRIAQPVLFAVEYALARLWERWGIRPQAMIGHSVGEYVAACLAGVLSLDDALALVAARGRLMQEAPAGAMLAVPLPEAEVLSLLGSELSLATVNAPDRCVVAGPEPAVQALAERLAGRGVAARRLAAAHAFHSPAMAAAARPFLDEVRRMRLRPPERPYLSNVTGTWIRDEEATDPQYWVRHLLQTVRFADGAGEVLREPSLVLLEAGPGRALGDLARRHPRRTAGHPVLASLAAADGEGPTDLGAMLTALGRLWQMGVEIDWDGFHRGERRRRVVLPTYPFERRRYWIDPGHPERPAAEEESRAAGPDDLFWAPVWTESPIVRPAGEWSPGRRWILCEDGSGLGAELAGQLRARAQEVTVVRPGETVDDTLLAATAPMGILHLACDGAAGEAGFYRLLALGQALGRRAGGGAVDLWVVASGLADVAGDEPLRPEVATLLGPCRVIPLELPEVACRAVDVVVPAGEAARAALAGRLLAELAARAPEPLVAWRGRRRWVRHWRRVRPPAGAASPLRQAGVYLITGGLGGVGLAIARHLARAAGARLVLLGRTPLPPREEWPAHRIGAAVLELESLGAEVMTLAADVTDAGDLRRAVAAMRERFGALHGVVHAAGVAGGGILLTRTPEAAAAVLAPKVAGTRALAAALEGLDLDFLALFSSILGSTGAIGQIDYAAANAYLDAFAQARAAAGDARTVSIDWDLWREVGMARPPRPESAGGELRRRPGSAGRAVFATALVAGEDWLLGEHRVLGRAVLPGTACLELARAAVAAEGPVGGVVELRDVILLAPLAAADGETVEVRVVLEPAGEGFEFRVVSLSAAAPAGREHARGAAVLTPRGAPRRLDPDRLLARPAREVEVAADLAGGSVEWGARWRSLRRVSAGAGEAVAWLELPAPFRSDLESFVLHPALLDVATGFVNQILGGGVYLPLSYGRVRVEGPLPARLLSHARGEAGEPGETVTVDLTLLDEEGNVRVEIAGFTLRRVDPEALERAVAAAPQGSAAGLSAREGCEAFERILAALSAAAAAGGSLSQIAVSPRDLSAAAAGPVSPAAAAILERPAPPRHPRPDLGTPYEPPRDEVERGLAEIWRDRLGVDAVGIHDNFFELGGDSVLAIQILAAVHEIGLSLRPNDLFRHPTVAGLAELLATAGAPPPPETPAAVPPPPPDPGGFPLARLSAGELGDVLARFKR
jgi:acyl transferase domain-containing protein